MVVTFAAFLSAASIYAWANGYHGDSTFFAISACLLLIVRLTRGIAWLGQTPQGRTGRSRGRAGPSRYQGRGTQIPPTPARPHSQGR